MQLGGDALSFILLSQDYFLGYSGACGSTWIGDYFDGSFNKSIDNFG